MTGLSADHKIPMKASYIESFARAVAAGVHPKLLFTQLLPEGAVPEDAAMRMAHWKSESATFRMNVALAELPSFAALPGDGEHLRSYRTTWSQASVSTARRTSWISSNCSVSEISGGASWITGSPRSSARQISPRL